MFDYIAPIRSGEPTAKERILFIDGYGVFRAIVFTYLAGKGTESTEAGEPYKLVSVRQCGQTFDLIQPDRRKSDPVQYDNFITRRSVPSTSFSAILGALISSIILMGAKSLFTNWPIGIRTSTEVFLNAVGIIVSGTPSFEDPSAQSQPEETMLPCLLTPKFQFQTMLWWFRSDRKTSKVLGI